MIEREWLVRAAVRGGGAGRIGGIGRVALASALLALAVYGAALVAALARDTFVNGWIAYDTRAYWLAARHVLDGSPLYAPSLVTSFGAYKYPPIFAQLLAPACLLPADAVDWAWRGVSVFALRYVFGSWRAALVAAALWAGFLLELQLGNVTFVLAAACLFALRDRRGGYVLPWLAALKFGPALLIAYLWFRRPEWRRDLVRWIAIFAGACAVSFAVAPGLWLDYLGTFGWETSSTMQATGILAIVPSHGGLDFAIRFAIAALAVVVAAHRRWDALAFAASVVTCPILTVSRLAALGGLWPLTGEWRGRVTRRVRQAPATSSPLLRRPSPVSSG